MNQRQPASHLLDLPAGAVLRLRHAAGTQITVLTGCAWATQEDDTRDIVLPRGSRFVLDRQGLAVVQMLEAGEVRIDAADPPPDFNASVRALLASFTRSLSSGPLADSGR